MMVTVDQPFLIAAERHTFSFPNEKILRLTLPNAGGPGPTRWSTWVSSQKRAEVRTCCQARFHRRRYSVVGMVRVSLRATIPAAILGRKRTRDLRERSSVHAPRRGKGRMFWCEVLQPLRRKMPPSAFHLVW